MSESQTAARHRLVGYFSCDADTEPTYDPPRDAPCLVCWKPLTASDVRTVSLTPMERAVASVFYRVHRTCAEGDPQAVEEIEHRIIEGEFLASDKEWL